MRSAAGKVPLTNPYNTSGLGHSLPTYWLSSDIVRLDEGQWRLFLVAAKVASQSSSVALRRTAAGALARMIARDCEKAATVGAAARLADFASDISAEVRAAANWQESEEVGQTNAE